MAGLDTTERPNKVSISDAGPSRKRISIQIPAETVSDRLRESLDTLAVEAQIPGFRKGRAPRGLIEKRFGSTLRADAKQQLIASAYAKAVEDHKLRVVGDPSGEHLEKVEVLDGKPLDFEIEVEVMPEFDLPSLDGIAVRKPHLEITDAMVSEEIEKICINEGRLEPHESAEPGDYLTGRGVMKGPDGTEFYNINGAVVQKPAADKGGKGMILGIAVDDFDKQLGSPKPGQTATIKATGPANHEIEGIRGTPLTMTFQVERVDQIVPAKVEELLAAFGMESRDQLKEAVRGRMDQRVMVQQQSVMRQQIAQYLVEHTEMALPERMTAQQAARTLERQRLELMYRGADPTQIEERIAELRAASEEVAARELKLFFILSRAAQDLNVKVEEAEINGRIAQMAAERNVRPEQLRQELIQRNQVGGVFQQIREHKTFDAILAKAAITEISAEEFAKSESARAPRSKPAAKPKADDKPQPKAKPEPKSEAKPKAKAEPESKPKPKKKG